MAHFAQLNENNIVINVLVIEQTMIDTGLWGDPSRWFQTSFNTRGGIYYIPNTNTPDPDQTKAFRKNFAGIGDTYLVNGPSGEGFTKQQPYPSWKMNNFSYLFEPPIPMPIAQGYCSWDESILNWSCLDKIIEIPIYPE